MLIAIDGPAASGKGTIGRKIAEHYGYKYLDTGKLYRYVGLSLVNELGNLGAVDNDIMVQIAQKAINQLNEKLLEDERLEDEEVGKAASVASALEAVRYGLLQYQRDFASSDKGAVLDGRDIGTVICPDADFKFFITAKPEIRAKRRYKQLQNRKKDVNEAQILQDILARDERDKSRDIAPLVQAEDAHYVDSSDKSIDDVFAEIVGIIDSSV
jgi:cytidylate kinase